MSAGDRRARLSAALRENLRKRRAKARERVDAPAGPPDPEGPQTGTDTAARADESGDRKE